MAASLQPGDLLAERFRIERHAGEGAMGTVFRAQDTTTQRPVAIKTVLLDVGAPPARFAREAEALAALHAEGVVRYVHHGLDALGRAFLVMEWIEGPTLAQALRERGMTPLTALRLGQRLAHALAAMHRAGIVHRDLKPGNIMLPAGELAAARIVDFGIARIGSSAAEITTQHGQLGTPRYMAPEQIRDPHAVDGRADVFALGCVLFECLTGVPAFGGDDPVTVLAQVLFQAASEPSALIATLPEPVDRLVGKLLAKQRERRPDAGTLGDELTSLLDSAWAAELAALPAAPARAPTIRAPASTAAVSATLTATVSVQPEPPLRASVERWPDRLHTLRATLPEAADALVGRENAIAALLPQLDLGVPVALWGSAGMGKTRLALELTQRALAVGATPIDAVLFVDLSTASNTADAVRMVADQAQLLLGATEQPEALVGALLAKLGRVLLVLDRVERLAGQIELLIRLWTSAAPRLQLIATSRVRLRVPHAFELGPLSTARAAAASGVPALSAAASLVLARARAVLPDLPSANALDARTFDALERIARALDGIPLAIELAAARASMLGIDGVLAGLSTPLELLAGEGSDARAITMRGAIAWSWAALSDAERQACMQCALFHDGFELEAAQAMTVLEPDAPPLLVVLQALREQSLLVNRPARDDALHLRFSMFGAVREFALEQLALHAPGESALAGAAARHAGYYAARAAEALRTPATYAGEPAALATLCVRERENLIAATEYALDAQPPDIKSALRLLRALEPVLLGRGPSSELARLLERALAFERAPSRTPGTAFAADLDAELAAARPLLARLLTPGGHFARARAELEAALDTARRLDLHALEASVWLDLGVVHHFARELEQAQRCYETALLLLAEHDDVVSEARCAGNLAAIAHDRGELIAALPGYRRAIALLESTREPRLLANFYGNLALCEHELSQLDAAGTSYQRALALLEPLGDARLLGIVLSNLGTLELAEGKLDAALAGQERACALLQDAGDPRSSGLAQGRRAVVLSLLDRMEEAERVSASAERNLRRDALGSAVLALLRAFVDLGHARRARRAGAFSQAEAELERAQQRAQHAERETLHGRRLYDQCDDIRLYLGLLLPELAHTRADLAQAHAGTRGQGAA